MNYLEAISLTKTLPCLADPDKIIVFGKPDHSLAEVIPFLATLPGVISYNPESLTLTFRRQTGFITLFTDKIYITQVEDNEEVLELFNTLTDAINITWEHRAELVAVTAARLAPRPLDVWTLLPQSNCKLCGEATCMAFAFGLLQQKHELEECLPLQVDAAFSHRRSVLEALL